MTREEKAWLASICAYGCICCLAFGRPRTPAEPHHILRNGRRMGHLFTLPLCSGHHRSGRYDDEFVSRHPYKTRWVRLFGNELDLLVKLQSEINGS